MVSEISLTKENIDNGLDEKFLNKIEIIVNKNLSKKIKQIKNINLKPNFKKQITEDL